MPHLTAGPTDTAIIGAGIAGMSAARVLADHGHSVIVFEKARGPGGRAARRRRGALEFDHGAQYFTAHDPAFAERVEAWRRAGIVEEWAARVVSIGAERNHREHPPVRYVGVPGMSSLARHLGRGVDVHYEHRLESIQLRDGGWMLEFRGAAIAGPFRHLLVTAPAPQTEELLAGACPELAARIATARMVPCWATMLAFEERMDVAFDAAFVGAPSPIRWLARNSSKPRRPAVETWVLHARPDWSIEHLERPADWVADHLTRALYDVVDSAPKPVSIAAHRWRYAMVDRPLGVPCLYDDALRVGAAGDWCLGPRIEAAFCSGAAAAARILGSEPEPVGCE